MNYSEVMPNKKVMPPGRKECNSVVPITLILSCSFYPADRSLAGNWHKTVDGKSRHLSFQAISKLSALNRRRDGFFTTLVWFPPKWLGCSSVDLFASCKKVRWLCSFSRWFTSHGTVGQMLLSAPGAARVTFLTDSTWHIFRVISCSNENC